MKDFYASRWIAMTSNVQQLIDQSTVAPGTIQPKKKEEVMKQLAQMHQFCQDADLEVSMVLVLGLTERFKAQEGDAKFGEIGDDLLELLQRMHDELTLGLILHIPNAKAKYFKDKEPFGPEVKKAFPSATIDLEEAAKCYALGRNVACVFHLMRVVEVALRVLGTTLSDPIDPKTNPTWERILKKCDDELKKSHAERTPEWQKNSQFFSEATANLRAVKDAWRNPTLHVEINYDEERAFDVWNAMRGFMRHLATGLHE